jgi:hypothetical protein
MEKDPLFEAISEKIRETKRLANAAWAGVEELRKQTQLMQEQTQTLRNQASDTGRKADAAWELVVLTRNQINRPWWKRVLGIN